VRDAVGLEFEGFLELARPVTAPASPSKPSPRRRRARQGAPSENARRARRADAQNRHRSRARRRGNTAGVNPTDGSIGCTLDTTGEVHAAAPGHGRKAGAGEAEDRDEDGGTEAQSPGAGGDRGFCEQFFHHYERFEDARRATTAFPHLEGGGGSERGRISCLREYLWLVLTFSCTSGGGCDLSQQELRRLYR